MKIMKIEISYLQKTTTTSIQEVMEAEEVGILLHSNYLF
jgi:hypothetical protein